MKKLNEIDYEALYSLLDRLEYQFEKEERESTVNLIVELKNIISYEIQR